MRHANEDDCIDGNVKSTDGDPNEVVEEIQ
jgi:hypothetical protein